MNRIRILPEQVANQIAAGEVIERPASVVKELVENALDAGATQVEVTVRGGGRALIRVSDNGWGMSRDDALLCLERHATSKLRGSEDLDRIGSYGFRGEALPSIASVCRFRLTTRPQDCASATELVVNGGKLISVQEAGAAPGTTIEVRSLFFNLPARRKFLRTPPTELAHTEHQLTLAGLARPDVGFRIQLEDRAALVWPTAQPVEQRVGAVFGSDLLGQLVAVEAARGGLRLSGFIGKPGVSRASRQEELLFVNGRPIDNRTFHFALLEGYHNALMRGRYPVAVLNLTIDPAAVDVNVHPAKREVRFRDDASVRSFVTEAVRETLRALPAAPVEVTLPGGGPRMESSEQSVAGAALLTSFPGARVLRETAAGIAQTSSGHHQTALPISAPNVTSAPAMAVPERSDHSPVRLLGIAGLLYVIAETPEGVMLIDQHAAHERILFEQMLARLARQEVLSQRLLLPVTVELPPRDADFLARQIPALNAVGVDLHAFGPTTFLLDGLPPMVRPRDPAGFVRDLAASLEAAGGEIAKARRLSEEVVAKTVCRHAVKARDTLSAPECEQLVADLFACESPRTCPHGRPTMVRLSWKELEKLFGRAA